MSEHRQLCPLCMMKVKEPCARVHCPVRKQTTAQPPEDYDRNTGLTPRRPMLD